MACIPRHVLPCLQNGNIQEEVERPAVPDDGHSPYTDPTQDLGDRLPDYKLAEDLIERGTLGENADGTSLIRLQ